MFWLFSWSLTILYQVPDIVLYSSRILSIRTEIIDISLRLNRSLSVAFQQAAVYKWDTCVLWYVCVCRRMQICAFVSWNHSFFFFRLLCFNCCCCCRIMSASHRASSCQILLLCDSHGTTAVAQQDWVDHYVCVCWHCVSVGVMHVARVTIASVMFKATGVGYDRYKKLLFL